MCLINNGHSQDAAAAAAVNVKASDLKRAFNRLKADNRADEVGILRTQWDNIALSSKQRLSTISTDEGFKDAVSLTFRANLPPDTVFEIVQALNAVRSSTRHQELRGCSQRPHPGDRRRQLPHAPFE